MNEEKEKGKLILINLFSLFLPEIDPKATCEDILNFTFNKIAKEASIKVKSTMNLICVTDEFRNEINKLLSTHSKHGEDDLSRPIISSKNIYQKFKNYNNRFCLANNIQLSQKITNNYSYCMCKNLCRLLAINGFKDFKIKSISNYFSNLTLSDLTDFNDIVRQMYTILDNFEYPNQIINAPMCVRIISLCIAIVLKDNDEACSIIGRNHLIQHQETMESELDNDIKTIENFSKLQNSLNDFFKDKFQKLNSRKSAVSYISQAINKKYKNKRKIENDDLLQEKRLKVNSKEEEKFENVKILSDVSDDEYEDD